MISNAGPRRTSEQDCSKKEKRKTPGVQQSVTKDLRGKINKTPTGAFKMCTSGRFGPRCCKSQLKDEVTSFIGWKVQF